MLASAVVAWAVGSGEGMIASAVGPEGSMIASAVVAAEGSCLAAKVGWCKVLPSSPGRIRSLGQLRGRQLAGERLALWLVQPVPWRRRRQPSCF